MDDTSRLDLTFEDALRRAREDSNHLCIPGVEVEAVSADGVPCEWLRSDASDPKRVILYLHGGGYVSCSLLTHRNVMSRLSTTSRAVVLGVDYRLAPVHPFPCALEDATKAYCWLLDEGYSHKQIALAGDSAGGGLALALLQKIKMGRESSVPPSLPSACVLFSPWTDLTIGGKSIIDNYETDRLFNPKQKKLSGSFKWLKAAHIKLRWRLVAKMYAQWPTSLKDPLVSPLFGDLSGLPPTLIHCTAIEMLLDDSLRLSKVLEENGVPVKCKVWERGMHVFPTFDPRARETVECLADVATFLDGIWSASHMQEDEISDQADKSQEHEQCAVPLLAKRSFQERTENRVSISIWLAVLIIGPGAVLSLVNVPTGVATIACTLVGYKMSRRILRKLHKKVHFTVQHSVHRGMNEMYKREYNGQSIDHPYEEK